MEISVREAATLLERNPRTVRAQVARGELQGRKRNGHWRIRSETLPLTEDQRARLQAKAARIRDAVDDVLPSRIGGRRGRGRIHSVADLDAFRAGAEVLATIRRDGPDALDRAELAHVDALCEGALLDLAEATPHPHGHCSNHREHWDRRDSAGSVQSAWAAPFTGVETKEV